MHVFNCWIIALAEGESFHSEDESCRALELPRLTGLPVITGSHLNRFTEPVRVAANRCFGHSTRTFILM